MKHKAKPKPPAGPPPVATAPKKSYVPTPLESAATQRLLERRKRETPAPKFNVEVTEDATNIAPNHLDQGCNFVLLCDTLATGDINFANGMLHQIAGVSRSGKELNARELNTTLATIRQIGPRDAIETLLAIQMTAIHNAMIVAAGRLNHVETIDQQNSASNLVNKLARTFAAEVETLKRYRSSGEQNVHVTHPHVNVSANQAVVGISQGGGGSHEKSSQSHAPSVSSQPGPSMLGYEQTQPMPLQSPSREGPDRVPDARREGGSTEGKSQRRVAARNGDK